jgi:hypothetical protein
MSTKLTGPRHLLANLLIKWDWQPGMLRALRNGARRMQGKMKLRKPTERRDKIRFVMNREVRYKLLEGDRIVASGLGTTENMSSGGVAFQSDVDLPNGSYIELSISWPMMLDDVCPMRLIVFGRVLRGAEETKVCTVEKWEFRTQSRKLTTAISLRIDGKLQRWAEYRKEVLMRATGPAAAPTVVPAMM